MIEIMQKRTTQLTVLSIAFVGMMMILLIPSLTGEAEAKIDAQAFAPPGTTFTDIYGRMRDGHFDVQPRPLLGGTVALWGTDSDGIFGGLEQGTVFANFRQPSGEIVGPVSFSFTNPVTGKNTCSGAPNRGPLMVTCYIPSSGSSVTATYIVSFRNQDSSTQCDILTSFGGLDQLKIIQEKLRC